MAERNRPNVGLGRWFKWADRQSTRVQQAREKAASYGEGQPPTAREVDAEQTGNGKRDNGKRENGKRDDESLRTIEEWSDIVGQRIEEAMRKGAFDNLSGHGKPLTLDRDPLVPEEQQMANTLLRNNDLVPDWISDRKSALAAIDRFRGEVGQVSAKMRDLYIATASLSNGRAAKQAELEVQWQEQITQWEGRVVELNRQILTLNLKQPIAHLEILQLRMDDELKRAGARRTLGT